MGVLQHNNDVTYNELIFYTQEMFWNGNTDIFLSQGGNSTIPNPDQLKETTKSGLTRST